jgi:hypothetical protein
VIKSCYLCANWELRNEEEKIGVCEYFTREEAEEVFSFHDEGMLCDGFTEKINLVDYVNKVTEDENQEPQS